MSSLPGYLPACIRTIFYKINLIADYARPHDAWKKVLGCSINISCNFSFPNALLVRCPTSQGWAFGNHFLASWNAWVALAVFHRVSDCHYFWKGRCFQSWSRYPIDSFPCVDLIRRQQRCCEDSFLLFLDRVHFLSGYHHSIGVHLYIWAAYPI